MIWGYPITANTFIRATDKLIPLRHMLSTTDSVLTITIPRHIIETLRDDNFLAYRLDIIFRGLKPVVMPEYLANYLIDKFKVIYRVDDIKEEDKPIEEVVIEAPKPGGRRKKE